MELTTTARGMCLAPVTAMAFSVPTATPLTAPTKTRGRVRGGEGAAHLADKIEVPGNID